MRVISPALQAKLDSGVTTLCRCWTLTRRDGLVMGFTDHDEDVVVETVIHRAATGLNASEATAKLGLAVGGGEIGGALADESLSEGDLAAGLYDAATIELRLVDWTEPELNVLISAGTIGEIRREGTAFVAEMRGPADRLAQTSGRLYAATCSADLGDERCTVALDDPTYRGTGSVATLLGASHFVVAGLDSYADGWFTAGKLTWTSGQNDGLAMEVKIHRVAEDGVSLTLWQSMAWPIAEGDGFFVTAGCDKRYSTCRDRFDNAVNFRGFPHIPGNDFVIRYAVPGEPGNDGRSLFGAL
jgi:uncharacterized phage protein (TIGR02218 family)